MTSLRGAVPIAEVTRRDVRSGRDTVESVHLGHVVVVDPDGEVAGAVGDPRARIYVRSAAKPFQAGACVELLARHGAPLPPAAELAVAWASHRGEPEQLRAVRELLARSGTPPEALTCPPGVPEADPGAEATRLGYNCSGKHALFALAGPTVDCPPDRLLDPDGPLQRHVLAALDEAIGPASGVGVDGCGAPAVAVPLVGLATGYRDLAVDPRWEPVRAAGLAHPGLVGGRGRLESTLLGCRVVAKVGAEGVYGAGWTHDGAAWGVAVKCLDGAVRGASAALIALLEALGVVPAARWAPDPPTGGGAAVGQVRATPAVQALAVA